MKAGTNDSSSSSNGGGKNATGAARVDRLIDSHRDLLLQPGGGECLAEEIEARLMHPWCADLPAVMSRRLPLLRRLWLFAKRWAWRLMLLYLLYAASHATVNFYFEKQIDEWQRSDAYTDLSLSVNFLVRKFAVWTGTPKMDTMQQLAGGKCIVDNPVFRGAMQCCNCKFNVTLSKVTNVPKVMENFDKLTSTGKARSFVIVNYQQEPVSYQQIRETAQANMQDMNVGYNSVAALSGPRVSSIEQLFADANEPPADSAVMWHFSHVEALRHFRQLIRRPNFISRSLEISLTRQFLFIGSRNEERVSLGSLAELDGQVYIVGLAGEMIVTVRSSPDCCRKPENRVSKAAALRPGRLISLPSACYEVLARRNGTGYAAAYMGAVVMAQHPAMERAPGKIRS